MSKLTLAQEGQIDQIRMALDLAFEALYVTTPGTAQDNPEFYEKQVAEAFSAIQKARKWMDKLAGDRS